MYNKIVKNFNKQKIKAFREMKPVIIFPPLWKRLWIALQAIIKFGFKPLK